MYIKSAEAKRIGKENMNFQWGASLLILAIYAVLLAAGNAIPVIGSVVVAGPLLFGLRYIYYRASFKEEINYWDIFKGFETQFGDSFLAFILVQVYTILWSLLFVVPGVIKKYSYAMYMYILMREPELNATEAIDKSMRYMSGSKWRLFCLDLSFLGWDILKVITCGLLAVYVEPWKAHAKTAFFNDLYEQKRAAENVSSQAADSEADSQQTAENPEAAEQNPEPMADSAFPFNKDFDIDPRFVVNPEDKN